MKNQSWRAALQNGFVLPTFGPEATLPEVVNLTLKAISEHLRSSVAVREYLSALPKGPGTSCPDSPVDELVKYIAVRNAKMDKSDPVINLAFMWEIMMPVFSFSHGQIFAAVAKCQSLATGEIDVFRFAQKLAEGVNWLWASWFERVVVPYQQLSVIEQAAYKKDLGQQLGEFDYTVFDLDQSDEGFVINNRQTWAQAFPEQVEMIRISIISILDCLSTDDKTLANYLRALSSAYDCKEIAELEERWAQVDQCWIEIPANCRILAVHGMENGYEHPFCVSPEFRLEVRDSQTQELINQVRTATTELFGSLSLDDQDVLNDLTKLLGAKLDRLDVGTFLPAIVGGVCLNFRYAGQAVPNRQVILAQGGKIFLDPTSTEDAARDYPDFLRKHCTPKTAELLIPLLTAQNILRYIAHHEFFHPAGCTPESDQVLGSAKTLLEEAKATIGGILAWEQASGTHEQRLVILAVGLARIIRHLDKTKMSDPAIAPYIRKSLALALILFDAGVIELTDDGIELDVTQVESIEGCFLTCRDFVTDIIIKYNAADIAGLQAMQEEYCNTGPNGAEALIKWINR